MENVTILIEQYREELKELRRRENWFKQGGGHSPYNNNEFLEVSLKIYMLEKHLELLKELEIVWETALF